MGCSADFRQAPSYRNSPIVVREVSPLQSQYLISAHPGERKKFPQGFDKGLYSTAHVVALEKDEPTLLPGANVAELRKKGYLPQREGETKGPNIELMEDAESAVLPTIMELKSVESYRFLHGDDWKPRSCLNERVQSFANTYDVPKLIAGACVRLVEEAGWQPERAAKKMRHVYDQAVRNREAFHQPWNKIANELLKEGF
jgi:hypothetical protein